ncbi:unnamed protein product [Spirodela intermedia]|uniref:Uncharacterized protein n=1 Tax=Spirodela intermedia TaxID=51605 RepID=A0A7I8IHZ3_SPIIN|nr:unnamed protein product [Spirodela intermedia]CAA6656775.1 unnamed protein product [Spirodela intermedia]
MLGEERSGGPPGSEVKTCVAWPRRASAPWRVSAVVLHAVPCFRNGHGSRLHSAAPAPALRQAGEDHRDSLLRDYLSTHPSSRKRADFLSQAQVMGEALAIYQDAIAGRGLEASPNGVFSPCDGFSRNDYGFGITILFC